VEWVERETFELFCGKGGITWVQHPQQQLQQHRQQQVWEGRSDGVAAVIEEWRLMTSPESPSFECCFFMVMVQPLLLNVDDIFNTNISRTIVAFQMWVVAEYWDEPDQLHRISRLLNPQVYQQ
jgi:hypothetical protein